MTPCRPQSLFLNLHYVSTATATKTGPQNRAAQATGKEGEQNLAEMQKTLILMQDHPGFDLWAQPLTAMDVVLPYKLFPKNFLRTSHQIPKLTLHPCRPVGRCSPKTSPTPSKTLEKRMFMNSNWVARKRVWAKPGAEVKA
ncbi:hypothetical protein K435DRAFT_792858 [Dendrothele bispora CBS 962.96]|uniref:Uncharacterized protein n=1 Tax=Dendrothele bispora (strain CBS 962.96) TaxID=1314807 RepID=A0A4S8MHI6_DENBC|nr:hypothetical protein K435DRAFT_792858 [Dendrothele bispora CBS 962.96]